jgi:signal peptidase I
MSESDSAPTQAAEAAPPPEGDRAAKTVARSHARRNLFAVGVFVVVVILFTSTFRLAVVRGESMLPTYRDGQLVLVNKVRALNGPLNRGDVVLVEHGNDVLIKRVAFLPGDEIPPRDTWMFRRVLEFFDVLPPTPNGPPFSRLKVPPGFLVVLGDNRRVSEDSRAFGPVKENEVIGRVVNAPSKP